MRVAFFVDSFRKDLGGLTRAVIQLHDLLRENGFTVRVYALPQRGGPLHAGDVHTVPALSLDGIPGIPKDSWLAFGYRSVLKSLAGWEPDVVHLHTPFPVSWLGLFAARALSLPVIATCHVNLDALRAFAVGAVLDRPVRVLAVELCNRSVLVTTPSAFTRDQLRRAGVRQPIEVVSNGVDLGRFTPRTEKPGPVRDGPVTALFAGRLSREKGTCVLAEGLRQALAEEPRLRAVVAGDGPDRPLLDRALRPFLDRVEFRGHVPWEEMPTVYGAADLLVFPSPHESQGLVVLEAMAAALPVVAVRAGAVPELVVHGETGCLVPPGDAGALAEAVVRLARCPEERRRIGRRGRGLCLIN
ncbi:MAG: glycosyltransferase, partial [Clostridia bacterium]|nr:glycosyltransferase [Clostridia bacterium]